MNMLCHVVLILFFIPVVKAISINQHTCQVNITDNSLQCDYEGEDDYSGDRKMATIRVISFTSFGPGSINVTKDIFPVIELVTITQLRRLHRNEVCRNVVVSAGVTVLIEGKRCVQVRFFPTHINSLS